MRHFVWMGWVLVWCTGAYAQSGEKIFLNNSIAIPSIAEEVGRISWPENNCRDSGDCYAVIQLQDVASEETLNVLADLGIQLHAYIPSNAYLASYNGVSSLELPPFIIAVLPIINSNKRPHGSLNDLNVAEEGTQYHLVGLPFPGVTSTELAGALEQIGAAVHQIQTDKVHYDIPAELLPAILSCPELLYTESTLAEPIPEGIGGANNGRINGLNQGPGAGYDGTGVHLGIAEDGTVQHEDFRGRVVNHLAFDNGDHGEMTVGKAIGAGNIDPAAVGAAPGATVHLFNINTYEHINNAIANYAQYGIVITSTSFGEGCGEPYNTATAEIDAQVVTQPELCHVFSAGNNGTSPCYNPYSWLGPDGLGNYFSTITGGRKAGKNVIAVANNFQDDQIVGSSSLGPARDGRLKPDLAANGQGDYTTGSNNSYRLGSGTSAAAPTVAGALAGLYQYYREQNGVDPSSALMKAVVLNSADDLGAYGPDFRYGWGRLNARKALQILQAGNYLEGSITSGQQLSFQLPIPAGARRVKVMLYWHDPAASPLSAKALVNDLDLRLQNPDGGLHFPLIASANVNLQQLNAAATEGTDRLNNVEQIVLEQPSSGFYNIQINGHQIPQGPQSFYVVYQVELEDIRVTFPQEGSTFVPGELSTVNWDAVSNTGVFGVDISTDGGQSWQSIAENVGGAERQVLWTVPNTPTSQMRARLRRGGQQVTSTGRGVIVAQPNFSIQSNGIHQGLIRWDAVEGASKYEVFQLGDRYMESLGETTALSHPFTATHGEGYWLSVRAKFPDNRAGRRAVAQYYEHFSCEHNLTLSLQFDRYPGETAWFILDAGGEVLQSGGPYPDAPPFSSRQESICLPTGCFTLIMTDSHNDGMCCGNGQGAYTLTDVYTNVLASGGVFSSIAYDLFCAEDHPLLPLNAAIDILQNPTCQQPNGGTLSANVTGGTGNYTYSWSNGSTSNTITALPPGTYSVTISDGTQTQSATTVLMPPPPLQLQVGVATAYCNDGAIQLQVAGGTAPFQVNWSDGGTGLQRTDLASGNYYVAITDANECLFTQWVNVPGSAPLQVQLIGQNPSCAQPNGGQITALVTGGSGNYQLLWNNGAQNSPILTGLGGGNYSLTVTDGNCQAAQTITLVAPTNFAVELETTAPTCANDSDGQINLRTIGGAGPFEFTWSDGGVGANRNDLAAGTYLVTVTDAFACTVVRGTTLSAPAPLLIAAETTPVTAHGMGQIILSVQGGIPPYQMTWNTGQVGAVLDELLPGNYTVQVTDANGCGANATVTIVEEEPGGLTELEYCTAQGANTTYEWIEQIVLNGTVYQSGNDQGLGDYTDLPLSMVVGAEQLLKLVPGYASTSYGEYWRVWIDFNQDGDFTDAGENVISAGSFIGSFARTFIVPDDLEGRSRMRVAMRYGDFPNVCANPSYGEVEDYTIVWQANDGLLGLSEFSAGEETVDARRADIATKTNWKAYPNPTTDMLYLSSKSSDEEAVQVLLYNNTGQLLARQLLAEGDHTVPIRLSLQEYPAGIYWVKVLYPDKEELISVLRD